MRTWFFLLLFIPGTCFATALQLTFPKESALQKPVDVQFSLEDDWLIARFTVKTKTINAKPKLGPKEYPYQRDVVEVFLSTSGSESATPYYEFELSPLGQSFEVRVDDLRKAFTTGLKMGVEYRVQNFTDGWIGEMRIPLKNLNWSGDPAALRGNAYAVLGKAPNRSFWSLFPLPSGKPNFHRPATFRSIFPL